MAVAQDDHVGVLVRAWAYVVSGRSVPFVVSLSNHNPRSSRIGLLSRALVAPSRSFPNTVAPAWHYAWSMTDAAEDALIYELLSTSRTIAVVGASNDPSRASHGVMRFLIQRGYDVFPVNPVAGVDEIHGRPVYPSLASLPEPVDIVDVFRRSEAAGAVCDEAIEIGARAIWMQLGVINEEGAARARKAGLKVVMDRCPRIEIPRLNIPPPPPASSSAST